MGWSKVTPQPIPPVLKKISNPSSKINFKLVSNPFI